MNLSISLSESVIKHIVDSKWNYDNELEELGWAGRDRFAEINKLSDAVRRRTEVLFDPEEKEDNFEFVAYGTVFAVHVEPASHKYYINGVDQGQCYTAEVTRA